jgi:hypothetical protein
MDYTNLGECRSDLQVSPGTFQSVIEDMVQVLDTEDIMAYLDDVICFHPTFEEHLEGISILFKMISDSGFLNCPVKSVSLLPVL